MGRCGFPRACAGAQVSSISMTPLIKKSDVTKLFPRRDPNSHKGQNGRVLIIGGSIDYFGAPILAALGALGAGADLVTLLVPECNFEVTRSFYPDFIVRKYPGNFVNTRTWDPAVELLARVDSVLIGPGVSENPESLRVITRIGEKAATQGVHTVLDAEAIPAIAQLGLLTKEAQAAYFTITPNRAEMDEIIEGSLPENPDEEMKLVENFSKKWGTTILLKTPRDVVASPGQPTKINVTGNAGMTVGGSGDVLSGVVASLIAQHIPSYDACQCAAFLTGLAGDNLYRQKGYNYIATDLALELPYTIYSVIG